MNCFHPRTLRTWSSSCLPVSISEARARARFWLDAPLILLLGVLAAPMAYAQGSPGDLLVTPTRIVLEGRQRTAQITLVNHGSSTATYRITFVNFRMTDNGQMTEIDTSGMHPGERFANELIRYSPRQVILEPGVAQTIRLQVRLPADLEPGEYRSHLLFRAIPSLEVAASTPEPTQQFSVQLTSILGVSIPVIVRHGATSATATLSELGLVRPSGLGGPPTLRFTIRRQGNQSIYGNLTATFIPARGKPIVVGMANGVAVYTPNPMRNAGITLTGPPGFQFRNGRLHLTYTEPDKGHEAIAEADLLVP